MTIKGRLPQSYTVIIGRRPSGKEKAKKGSAPEGVSTLKVLE
jgi:hypothetical protein